MKAETHLTIKIEPSEQADFKSAIKKIAEMTGTIGYTGLRLSTEEQKVITDLNKELNP